MDTDFDVLVLGAGPGGYVAAIRSAQLGLRTAVVEGRFWGGVCLNIGCIPAKALLRNAEVAQLILHDAEKFGVKISGDVSLDYHSAYERSRTVADGRAKGVGYLMRKNRIAQFEGRGTFIDPHTMQVRL
ncbi:FAD-dependent oxidoreductase, partial [Streptomyces sp. NPDC057927]